MRNRTHTSPTVGLVLSGGGARAAYQVGVLRAVADMLPRGSSSPFQVICGTSAGAINAAAVATHARHFRSGVRGIESIWRSMHAGLVYRTGMPTLTFNALRWLAALFVSGLGTRSPASLLDNAPMRGLLARFLRFQRLQEVIDSGALQALSVTASSYTTGESVTFFQGRSDLEGWRRARRVGRPAHIGLIHLMASSAIPAVFPPVRIGEQYYGDGSVRQLAPVSPALHLGADRVMVVGVGESFTGADEQARQERPPSVAQIAGHMLDSAFLDSLQGDLERLQRVNRTLELIPERVRSRAGLELRQVDTLVLEPSASLTRIALEHAHELPRAMRFYLRGSGATTDYTGAVITSYLLFEAGFCSDAIRLGYHDAMAREEEILRFLGQDPATIHGRAGRPPQDVW